MSLVIIRTNFDLGLDRKRAADFCLRTHGLKMMMDGNRECERVNEGFIAE